jgi:aryl-alcohol dehydrogenase-like predicted oxidoreductase
MTKIALGSVQFGVDYGPTAEAKRVEPQELRRILTVASTQGVRMIDTARSYGSSERSLGDAGVSDFEVVTKTSHFSNTSISSSDICILENDFETSLRSLKRDHVHGLLIHNSTDLLKPNADMLVEKLEDLKSGRRVKKIGVSIYDPDILRTIINRYDIDLVQLPLNILDRRMVESGMIADLQARGIEIHVRSIFLQGLLLMSKKELPTRFSRWLALWETWQQWLADNEITALEASVSYACSVVGVSAVIVGVENHNQLHEILKASSCVLPETPSHFFSQDDRLLNPSKWGAL